MDNNETDLTIIESGVSVAMTPEGNISKMKEDCTPDCTPDAFHDVATLVKAKPIAVDVGTPGANTPQYIVYPCATPDTTSTDGGSDTSSVREDSPIITNATVLLADCDSPYSTSSIDQLASSHTPAGAKVTWKPIASAMKSDAPKTPLTARKIKVVKASSGTKLLPPFLLKELKDDDHITTVQNLFVNRKGEFTDTRKRRNSMKVLSKNTVSIKMMTVIAMILLVALCADLFVSNNQNMDMQWPLFLQANRAGSIYEYDASAKARFKYKAAKVLGALNFENFKMKPPVEASPATSMHSNAATANTPMDIKTSEKVDMMENKHATVVTKNIMRMHSSYESAVQVTLKVTIKVKNAVKEVAKASKKKVNVLKDKVKSFLSLYKS
jgi:hypothetical protein